MINPITEAAKARARSRAGEARDSQIERWADGRLVFRSQTSFKGAGGGFTVYDVDQRSGKIRKVPHESPAATHRIFVMADKSRWVYPFAPDDSHALRAQLLELQLDDSTYVNGDAARANPR